MKTASRDSGEANESLHIGFTPFFSRKTERLNVGFQRLGRRNDDRDAPFSMSQKHWLFLQGTISGAQIRTHVIFAAVDIRPHVMF
jgi:hypothetical protein